MGLIQLLPVDSIKTTHGEALIEACLSSDAF